jgi:hypothetical protein
VKTFAGNVESAEYDGDDLSVSLVPSTVSDSQGKGVERRSRNGFLYAMVIVLQENRPFSRAVVRVVETGW